MSRLDEITETSFELDKLRRREKTPGKNMRKTQNQCWNARTEFLTPMKISKKNL